MSVLSFLRNYEIHLGDLGTEYGENVNTNFRNVILDSEENIEAFREAGTDETIQAGWEFNFDRVEDAQGNVFGDIGLENDYYQNFLFEDTSREFAKILIENGRRDAGCLEKAGGRLPTTRFSKERWKALIRCYLNRIFQVVAVGGFTRSFPTYEGEIDGRIIPIYSVLPESGPSGFQTSFLSSIIPSSGSEMFEPIDFSVGGASQIDRFRYEVSNPPGKIEDVFNPKETVSESGNIEFIFQNGDSLSGSSGSVLFKGDISFDGKPQTPYDVTVEFGQGKNATAKTEIGENAYITSEVEDITLHDFNSGPFELKTPKKKATLEYYTVDNGYEEIEIEGPYSESDPDAFIETFAKKISNPKYIGLTNDSGEVRAGGLLAYVSFSFPEDKEVKNKADPMTALFNLSGIYIVEGTPTINSSNIENIRDIEVASNAPFFEKGNGQDLLWYDQGGSNKPWVFITRALSPPTSGLSQINAFASTFTSDFEHRRTWVEYENFNPNFEIEDVSPDILGKAYEGIEDLGGGYDGFGGTVRRYDTIFQTQSNLPPSNREDAEEPLLEDFFKFHKQYIEENFKTFHIGLASDGNPIQSAPKQLTANA